MVFLRIVLFFFPAFVFALDLCEQHIGKVEVHSSQSGSREVLVPRQTEIFKLEHDELGGEKIQHECGFALIRLRKPIFHFSDRYSDSAWGMKKLLSLIEKQRNRGQDGAGIASLQFDMPSGQEFLQNVRSASENALESVFAHVMRDLDKLKLSKEKDEMQLKLDSPFVGEALLGHVRYATHSGLQLKFCQPFVRSHGVACRNIALAGNFNMTNTNELFHQLEEWGLSPISKSDTQVVLETIAYHLDAEYNRILADIPKHSIEGRSKADHIAQKIDLARVISSAAAQWDGGYVFSGILGNGDVFICRDPAGIRPGYYLLNDEIFAAASERVALMDVFDVSDKDIQSIKPGHIIVIKRSGEIIETVFAEPSPEKHCTFERIYFSKGHDPEIYQERKALGRELAQRVFEAVNCDLSHVVFTYVPNSSLAAFQGLTEGVKQLAQEEIVREFTGKNCLDFDVLKKVSSLNVRTEFLINKNQKLRTFISPDGVRKNLVSELYEVTKGAVTSEDILVVVDDSIVRGTTLKESLIEKLSRLNPKKIIIVSSAPPVLYPDCYGIDMSQLGRFVGFNAAIACLKEKGELELLDEVFQLCTAQLDLPFSQIQNPLKKVLDRVPLDELSAKVAQLLRPPHLAWEGELQVIYQSVEGLSRAIPNAKGDWYFTGDYPTPGGNRVVVNSFINWQEGNDSRSY